MSASHRLASSVAPIALLVLGGCLTCPPIPPLETLPGQDFATPERAFAYLKDAIIRGETSDAYAYHEFRCFSDRVKREQGIKREEYFFVRADALALIREKIGDPRRVRVEKVTPVAFDRAELTLTDGVKTALAVVVRENGYEVRFRDRTVEEVYGDYEAPSDGLRLDGSTLSARFAVAEALASRPGLTVDDVYEVRYVSEWKFYSVDGTGFVEDMRKHLDARKAEAPKTSGKL